MPKRGNTESRSVEQPKESESTRDLHVQPAVPTPILLNTDSLHSKINSTRFNVTSCDIISCVSIAELFALMSFDGTFFIVRLA